MIKLKKIKRFLSSFLASSLMLGMVSNATEITTNKISNEEVEIINQYVEGEKMLPEQVEARKNKAEELNLLDWVDKNYFLVDDFYRGKSEADIEELGANILVNTEFPFATAVASNEWPQASWKITPPNPLSIATGIFPAGQVFACSIV